MCYDLSHCILISAFCWLKCGINKPWLVYDWNPEPSVSSWNIWMFCLHVVEDEASLPCLQKQLLCLIMSHVIPGHTFITHLFMIPYNHLILLLCWNTVICLRKFEILHSPVLIVPCIIALNKILSMHRSQTCSLLLSPTEFFMFSYSLSLLHKHHSL